MTEWISEGKDAGERWRSAVSRQRICGICATNALRIRAGRFGEPPKRTREPRVLPNPKSR